MNNGKNQINTPNINDGDWFSDRNGRFEKDLLIIPFQINFPSDNHIKINGEEAQFNGHCFETEIGLRPGKNKVDIVNLTSGYSENIFIYRGDSFEDKYRLSIDDCIWFLKDINQHKNQYKSIFDNPFLSLFRELNQKYGTKVHFNLFYRTEGFDLSEMTDQFKDEWQANSDWIRLSFHAEKEFPDAPYTNADYQTVAQDCANIHREILRFAGKEVMSPVTTVHWGSANLEGCRALKDAGYKALIGYFNIDNELPAVSYYLNSEQIRNIKKKFIWTDNQENLLFIRTSIVIDTIKKDDIESHLNSNKDKDGRLPPFVDFLVHEQYFYPDYFNYQQDYGIRIETALKWALSNHYSPEFVEDAFLK